MYDQKYIMLLSMLDIFLMFVRDERIFQKRRMIRIGNIQMANQDDGL